MVTATWRAHRWEHTNPWILILAGFLAFRLFNVLVLWVIAMTRSDSVADLLFSWDSQWLIRAATEGWLVPDGGLTTLTTTQSTWAWPPLVPLIGMWISSALAVDVGWTLVALNLAGGAVAAVLLYRVVADWSGRRTGVIAALAWSAMPASPVFLMAYAEGAFLALCFGALLAMQRQRYLLSGLLLIPAGLTKLQVVPFALALAIVVLVARFREKGAGPSWLIVLTSVSLAGISIAAWPALVAWRFGALDAYSQVQQAWNWERIPFVATFRWLISVVAEPNRASFFAFAAIAIGVVAAVWIARSPAASAPVKAVAITGPAFLVFLGAGASTVRYSLSFPAVAIMIARLGSTPWRVVGLFTLLILGQAAWIFVFVAAGPTEWPP